GLTVAMFGIANLQPRVKRSHPAAVVCVQTRLLANEKAIKRRTEKMSCITNKKTAKRYGDQTRLIANTKMAKRVNGQTRKRSKMQTGLFDVEQLQHTCLTANTKTRQR